LARRLALVERQVEVERLAAKKQLSELRSAVLRMQVVLRQRRAELAEASMPQKPDGVPASELHQLVVLRNRIEEAMNGISHRGRLLVLNTLLAQALRDAGGTGRRSPGGAELDRRAGGQGG
jgi:hypothetical protein